MADVKWIKICTDIFDDEKILLIESMPDAFAIITAWFKLLCLAGKQNNDGVFMMNDRIPYTDEMLATIFRMPLNTVRLALTTFERYGMISVINDVITIPNWGKHQNLDAIERNREQSKLRMREYRERQKLLASGDVTQQLRNVTQTDKEEEKKENKNKNKKRVFTPPTLEEVKQYVKDQNLNVDPVKFFNYFTVGNWIDSKGNPVRNWKQKMLTWADKSAPAVKKADANDNAFAESVKRFMQDN